MSESSAALCQVRPGRFGRGWRGWRRSSGYSSPGLFVGGAHGRPAGSSVPGDLASRPAVGNPAVEGEQHHMVDVARIGPVGDPDPEEVPDPEAPLLDKPGMREYLRQANSQHAKHRLALGVYLTYGGCPLGGGPPGYGGCPPAGPPGYGGCPPAGPPGYC